MIQPGAFAQAQRQTGAAAPQLQPPVSPTWQPLGPGAVLTPAYGLVTGRVPALALDPSDATGNHLYVGTTGGGVWEAQNAAVSNPSEVVFTPLTDTVEALSGARHGSISIGALTVQPGATGVILAGTGDPNDALDSYYGAGILRSADGGNSWTLISTTADGQFSFVGEGPAGFAWSSLNPDLVVVAVSQAYEALLVNADVPYRSFEGLYYSNDGGATWNLATIADGATAVVQGPGALFSSPDGNAATSVVWNAVRRQFIAAVRFHGYYESSDGITWTRLPAQPGAGLTSAACPTNPGQIGSIDCPIFRGTLAVNPLTGDTFAWTVDISNQDQGLWQDQCAINSASCSNQNITFGEQWKTQALEANTVEGAATIANGDYNLALAAVPAAVGQGEDTWLLAGANDLWKCSLAMGCVWRNTTNATTCMSAQVPEFQHALAWSTANPLEVLIGNDSGLWRSLDAIGETGPVCAASDATHFQNLNGGLGSLAEIESMADPGISPYIMMAGLGVNGTAGLKSATASNAEWPQILGGYGGPVAIDPRNTGNWYVNNQDGVSIYLCSDATTCTPADFGTGPVVSDADVEGDGNTMSSPAPFMVDPLDPAQLLIGTCRMWRGPANGVGWSRTNAVSPLLDNGALNVSCSGNALIRSLAAMPLADGTEVVYAGMYGSLDGAGTLPGHVLTAIVNAQSTSMPMWRDLTLNPVTNSTNTLNRYGLDISSIFIDSHDLSGNTVYVTVAGFPSTAAEVQTVYGSTDGGAHWASLTANLPTAPVNGVVVDPQSASTVYLATDAGVYFTTQVSSCMSLPSSCWSVFGTGLPEAPVVQLSASATTASVQVLTAGTYGRGVWQTPLWTATASPTMATADPSSLTFPSQAFGTSSPAQTVTLKNTGGLPLTPTAILMSGDFNETDTCQGRMVAAGATCSILVSFIPSATGSRTGQMIISANVYGGQLSVALQGTGTASGVVTLAPATVSFDPSPGQVSNLPPVLVGTTSALFQVEAGNSGATPIPITSVSITPPFTIAGNLCGATALAGATDCQLQLAFTPTQEGLVAGALTIVDGAGTQTVLLSGFGYAPPTDLLNPTSLTFPATAVGGQASAPLKILLTNTGDLPLTCIVAWTGAASTTPANCIPLPSSGAFQASNTCNGQLAAHSACTISVVFAPPQLGIQTGTLTVYDSLHTQTVALSGLGVQPPVLSVSPTSLTFAPQNVSVSSPPSVLTITNSGGVAAANVGFELTGLAATSFATGTMTCAPNLDSGSSCAVQVVFTPAAAGGNAATLTVVSATPGANKLPVPLNGQGETLSGLNVNPPQLTFAATVVGSSTAAQTVTVSNTSSIAASQLTLSVLPAEAGFSLMQNACSNSLAPGANCTVAVVFAPPGAGPATAVLHVTSASIGNTAIVDLSGAGALASGIQLTPATIITFPTTGVGQASSPTLVTVTNTGSLNTLANLLLSAPPGFQVVSNTCAATLGPGLSCTAGVEFLPTAAGEQAGSLNVTSTTPAIAASLPLQGMGFDFTLALSGSGTQSVSRGQTASYTLVLTTLNSSSGAFTFECDALPIDALCVFNPTGETLNAGVSGNVTVVVSTGKSTASARLKDPGVWAMVPLVCGLLLLPLACPVAWNRRRRNILQTSVLLAAMALLAGGVASCTKSGGGSGGGIVDPGSGTTPAGTYSIPITVKSTLVSHSMTVTLTVD